jgi:hypothetical protein
LAFWEAAPLEATCFAKVQLTYLIVMPIQPLVAYIMYIICMYWNYYFQL